MLAARAAPHRSRWAIRPTTSPSYEDSIEADAKRTNRDATELLYDRLLERDGRELFLVPVLNYSELTADPIREMMYHPRAVARASATAARTAALICDASHPDVHAHALGARPQPRRAHPP